MRCTVIGLGEAGAKYATALVHAGHHVTGIDPADNLTPPGVQRATDPSHPVATSDVVLVMTGAAASPTVARQCAPHLPPGSCYADFTSSAPRTMEQLAAQIDKTGVMFADVAILGPVPVTGAKTPVMISGTGRTVIAPLLTALGAPVEVLDAPAGAAMAHKLLRSVLMKGLAAIVVEAVEAGRATGSEQWIRDQIARQLAGDGHAVIDRFLTGTRNHATRRAHEMADTAAFLQDLGLAAEMSQAAHHALLRIATEASRTTVHAGG